ncbi:MAG: hypothetical protein ABI614_13795 [Planctomycetota bacterium]
MLFVRRASEPLAVDILDLPRAGTHPAMIDYETLPKLKGEHAVVSRATRNEKGIDKANLLPTDLRFDLHNYLAHFDGRFWCIWSDGPEVEDWPTEEVRFAGSDDGMHWRESGSVTGVPGACRFHASNRRPLTD